MARQPSERTVIFLIGAVQFVNILDFMMVLPLGPFFAGPLGAVMGAFSVSAVLGVPAGLELARWGGWRLPFFSVAALGLVLLPIAIALLPPLTGHLVAGNAPNSARTGFVRLLSRPIVQLCAIATVALMASAFLVIPVVTPYLVFNLRFPD